MFVESIDMARPRQGFRVRDAYGGRDSEARQNGTRKLLYAAWVRLRWGFGATRCWAQAYSARALRRPSDGAYIRFCETNPPFFDRVFDVTVCLHGCYVGMLRDISVGSFWKTNPKTGG